MTTTTRHHHHPSSLFSSTTTSTGTPTAHLPSTVFHTKGNDKNTSTTKHTTKHLPPHVSGPLYFFFHYTRARDKSQFLFFFPLVFSFFHHHQARDGSSLFLLFFTLRSETNCRRVSGIFFLS